MKGRNIIRLTFVFPILLLGLTAACGSPPGPETLTTPTHLSETSKTTPVTVASITSTVVTYQPGFKATQCWGAVPPGVLAACGFVVVPENRSQPFSEANSIRLAIEVLRIAGVRYTQPPTFLLGGGPGQDVVGLFVDTFQDYQYILDNGYPSEQYIGHLRDMKEFKAVMDLFVADLQQREFVIFDQRGSGYSRPSLKCHGEDWDVCRRRLVTSGVDIASFNTLENVRDVDDIRLALGYDQINLQGGSYGTRLALEILRQYPQNVRSAVLDGVAPPQVNWATEMVTRYGDALKVLFNHCREDPACDAAYPDLETVFYTLIERLNADPIGVQVGERNLSMHGDDLRDLVWNALYDYNKIRFLPMLIGQASQGRTKVWGQMLASAPAEPGEETIAWGMHFAVDCAERWAYERPQDLITASASLHPAIREAVVHYFADTFEICEQWNVPQAPAYLHSAVKSDVPTLLVSGEFDPGTPPAFAEIAAQTLNRHYTFVFPYMGHTDGFTNFCYSSVISTFLDDPAHAPDASCITQTDKSVFVVE